MNVCINSQNTFRKPFILGNPKDKPDMKERSGSYKIACSDCDKVYIGQTKRAIGTRFKEHIAHYRYGRTESSSVAQHINETGHDINYKTSN